MLQQLGWRRPRKALPALIPFLDLWNPWPAFLCCHIAWKHIYIFWIGQLVHTPLPVSLAPGVWHCASSALMAQPLVVITGHCFCPTDPPSTARSPFCLSPSSMLIAQFNTRTSERINKTRQVLPVFYMASERWIHAFVIMINAAVYYFYCRSGLNIAILSYLSAVKICGKKVSGRWYPRPSLHWGSGTAFFLGKYGVLRVSSRSLSDYTAGLHRLGYGDSRDHFYVLRSLWAETTVFSAHHVIGSLSLLYYMKMC